jgi:dATP pyrophosphohydrolase
VNYKKPVSVLVVVHTADLHVLLLERATRRGFWQSVTGSQEDPESIEHTAMRELREETGIDAGRAALQDWHILNHYEIFADWRWRYQPGVTRNIEHVFSLEVPSQQPVAISAEEHLGYLWLPWRDAAQKVFSWSNRDAILMLPHRVNRDRG